MVNHLFTVYRGAKLERLLENYEFKIRIQNGVRNNKL
jgi:hypothetical protein